ncbi:hypothetical protein QBC35DRAFT_130518 [Podospora australis]|uniref:Uncharacterized protein n=1 Tax=Podospora australis TaxID=1536484 RepID=A0AAN6WKS5_9PEZI|nr:hypothetical protein QBC35DRAFT_130518 [Podospora australis]
MEYYRLVSSQPHCASNRHVQQLIKCAYPRLTDPNDFLAIEAIWPRLFFSQRRLAKYFFGRSDAVSPMSLTSRYKPAEHSWEPAPPPVQPASAQTSLRTMSPTTAYMTYPSAYLNAQAVSATDDVTVRVRREPASLTSRDTAGYANHTTGYTNAQASSGTGGNDRVEIPALTNDDEEDDDHEEGVPGESAALDDLLSCGCEDCKYQRDKVANTTAWATKSALLREDSVGARLLLPILIYLGKLHLIHPIIKTPGLDPHSVIASFNSGSKQLESLFQSATEQQLFKSAYYNSFEMFKPRIFKVQPNGLCPEYYFPDNCRFPFYGETLLSRGSFGTVYKSAFCQNTSTIL